MNFDLDLDLDMNILPGKRIAPEKEKPAQADKGLALCDKCQHLVPPRCIKRKTQNLYRRAFSETQLLTLLDYNLEQGVTYHVISGGDIDSFSFLKHILRAQPLDYLLLSTWCMANDDVLQLSEWTTSGRIKRVDAYVGEIFPGSYRAAYAGLKDAVTPSGGRVCVFKNHSKIMAGIGPDYAFAVESSANINTNPRTENTAVTTDRELFIFYKQFFDGIKSFTKDFDDWTPWSTA